MKEKVQKVSPQMVRDLCQKKPFIVMRDFLFDVGIIVFFLVIGVQSQSWAVRFFSILLIGIFQYRLQILGHDGLHYSVFENKKVNDFFGHYFLSGPIYVPFLLNRQNHLNHHASLGSDKDRDQHYYSSVDKSTKLDFAHWLVKVFFIAQVGLAFKILFGTKKEKTSGIRKDMLKDLLAIAVAQLVILGIFALTSPSLVMAGVNYILFWFVPAFFVYIPLNCIRSFCEHSLPKNEQSTDLLYSFDKHFLNWIFAPHNMNLHLEHHHYMVVPYYNLPKLSAIYKSESVLYKNDRCRPHYLRYILTYWLSLK